MSRERAIPTVLERLIKVHGEVTEPYLFETYFSGYGEGILERVQSLGPSQGQALIGNANEWLLAEGRIEVAGEERAAMDRAIELAGDDLSDEQRAWLQAVTTEPLDLYEVQDHAGDELAVRSLLRSDEAPRTFPAGPLGKLPAGLRLGLRVVPWEGGYRSTSALYAFPPDEGLPAELPSLDGAEASRFVVDHWLRALVGPPTADGEGAPEAAEEASTYEAAQEAPDADQVPDSAPQESGVGLTAPADAPAVDRYEVRELDALLEALAGSGSHEGDREGGWQQTLPAGDGEEAAVCRFELEGDDALVVACPSVEAADQAQDWLLEEVGPAVRFAGRERQV